MADYAFIAKPGNYPAGVKTRIVVCVPDGIGGQAAQVNAAKQFLVQNNIPTPGVAYEAFHVSGTKIYVVATEFAQDARVPNSAPQGMRGQNRPESPRDEHSKFVELGDDSMGVSPETPMYSDAAPGVADYVTVQKGQISGIEPLEE